VIPYVVASDIFDRQSIKERKKIKVIEIFYTLPIVLFHSEVRNTLILAPKSARLIGHQERFLEGGWSSRQ